MVTLGREKVIEQNREDAINAMKELVSKTEGDITTLNPEVIEVDTSGEKWRLTGLPWNQIALELMKKGK